MVLLDRRTDEEDLQRKTAKYAELIGKGAEREMVSAKGSGDLP